MMKFYFSDAQLIHQPSQYMVHGRITNAVENANRAPVLIEALEHAGLSRTETPKADIAPILSVHADHYLEFLCMAYQDFTALPNHGPEVLANIHPYRAADAAFNPRGKPRTTGIIGRTGWYIGDLSAVITDGTYLSAIASAEAAIAAANTVLAGEAAAYALCRPPGHHAYVDRASGFCFLNNAAIAAELLRKTYAKVAILDFDTHHGDGTQAIFYSRSDVFVGSVHTDPSAYYPHFTGYAEERGAAAGKGANLNLPLAFGVGDAEFIAANLEIIRVALARGSEALVLSAGWDAHQLDPLSKLAVTTEAYARIGELYGRLNLPTVIIQEGGYSLEAVGQASHAFMRAFRAARGN